MKYISIFFTVLLIWIAVILIAIFRGGEAAGPGDIMLLFFIAITGTLILFLIGFSKK